MLGRPGLRASEITLWWAGPECARVESRGDRLGRPGLRAPQRFHCVCQNAILSKGVKDLRALSSGWNYGPGSGVLAGTESRCSGSQRCPFQQLMMSPESLVYVASYVGDLSD